MKLAWVEFTVIALVHAENYAEGARTIAEAGLATKEMQLEKQRECTGGWLRVERWRGKAEFQEAQRAVTPRKMWFLRADRYEKDWEFSEQNLAL
eukprot:1545429-Pleurochrysis_carterae.AAC.3